MPNSQKWSRRMLGAVLLLVGSPILFYLISFPQIVSAESYNKK